jgi:exonuclease III
MGDFNTLSPVDAADHVGRGLLQWLQQPRVPQRIRKKHLTTASVAAEWAASYTARMAHYKSQESTHICAQVYAGLASSNEAVIDYRPMCELLAGGAMVDDCPRSAQCSSSEPTGYSLIEGFTSSEIPPFRLDYVLVNPVLVDSSGQHSCHVVQDNVTHWLSDHYPVQCSL